ncbi:unnamed protein product, partial [Prorocentrum cordatum]
MQSQCPASALGALVTFWVGFNAYVVIGPALAPEGADWPRDDPGHELEDSSASATVTGTTAASPAPDFHCPAPLAPEEASPQPLRVAREGLAAAVELPVALVGASAAAAAAVACGAGCELASRRSSAKLALEPIGEARIHVVQHGEGPDWTHERQHAFERAGFSLDSETGQVVRGAGGAPRQLDAQLRQVLGSERRDADPDFPEVSSQFLRDSHWTTVMADRWAFEDDTLRLEARALVK